MPPGIRQEIGVAAIANKRNISNLSHKHSTSRKFVYSQKAKAESALENAFSEKPDDENVLFHIPVTKQWLEQVMLELILVCHSSYQGVIEFFRDILDRHTCKGTIFNVAHNTLAKALDINRSITHLFTEQKKFLLEMESGFLDSFFHNGFSKLDLPWTHFI